MKKFSDKDVLMGLRHRDDQIIRYIYSQNFEAVQRMILNNNGGEDDAEDIFQEALIVIFKRLREDPDFKLTSAFSTYIYSVARLIWLKKLRDSRKMDIKNLDREEEDYIEFEEPPPVLDKDLRMAIYYRVLETIPEDCQKILRLTGEQNTSADIAKKMGYRSESYVRKRRHFCKEFLVNRIKEDPEYKDMFD